MTIPDDYNDDLVAKLNALAGRCDDDGRMTISYTIDRLAALVSSSNYYETERDIPLQRQRVVVLVGIRSASPGRDRYRHRNSLPVHLAARQRAAIPVTATGCSPGLLDTLGVAGTIMLLLAAAAVATAITWAVMH